jgi:aryl-alcohol dehydrogenase-like predicted oxidoreductase
MSLEAAGTVELGGDLSVCRLGYGAMRLTGDGIWGPPKDRAEALAVLRRAIELGVEFIDTADSYGPHVNEEIIAEALWPYPQGLVIATKAGWTRGGPGMWGHNATPPYLRNAVEGSLKRLRLDCIDLFQLHIPDPMVSIEDSLGALVDMQSQGKIRHIGLSNVTKEHIERARKVCPIVSVQNRYSFADREWDYVLEYCDKNGIVFIPWFPLAAGQAAKQALDQVCKAHKATPMQVAVAWLLKRSPFTLPIPGTSSVKHLEENLGAPGLRLTEDEFQELSGVEELTFSR